MSPFVKKYSSRTNKRNVLVLEDGQPNTAESLNQISLEVSK
jgi:hypothetical protein